ncbi:MAG: family 16 glycoside hydrolase [Verrucomicrobiota bacterium]
MRLNPKSLVNSFTSLLTLAGLAIALTVASGVAADLEPTLGKKGTLLLEEKFDGTEVPKTWRANTGKLRVADGALHASEKKSDSHIGAFRYALPVQDCAVQIDFRFDGGRTFNLGFDPAPGELKKKGHLFSLTVTASQWGIMEHNDKADPNSKGKKHASGKVNFEKGKWYTLLLETKGEEVVVQSAGQETIRASAKDFRVKKPGLVFRVGGDDDQEISFDNVKVWELKRAAGDS